MSLARQSQRLKARGAAWRLAADGLQALLYRLVNGAPEAAGTPLTVVFANPDEGAVLEEGGMYLTFAATVRFLRAGAGMAEIAKGSLFEIPRGDGTFKRWAVEHTKDNPNNPEVVCGLKPL